jgi:hypothetical protein
MPDFITSSQEKLRPPILRFLTKCQNLREVALKLVCTLKSLAKLQNYPTPKLYPVPVNEESGGRDLLLVVFKVSKVIPVGRQVYQTLIASMYYKPSKNNSFSY